MCSVVHGFAPQSVLRLLGLSLLACALTLTGNGWAAPPYPAKPITLVIPFPPGGATDTIGRLLAQKLGEQLGQPVVIENRAGAGTVVGANYVAKAAADGYTLLASSGSTFTVNPALRPKLGYDPINSFDTLGIVARTGLILLAHPGVTVGNVQQFVSAVQARPQHYAYGSFGSGSTSHLAAEMVLAQTGLSMIHIPYKGSAPAMADLIGGQIPFTFDTVGAALPQIQSGKVKPVAVTTAQRSSLLPDVPSFAESGYPAIDMDTWLLLAAPKGLPSAVKSQLESALAAVMADAQVQQTMKRQGFEPGWADADAASALIRKELPQMTQLVRSANITLD